MHWQRLAASRLPCAARAAASAGTRAEALAAHRSARGVLARGRLLVAEATAPVPAPTRTLCVSTAAAAAAAQRRAGGAGGGDGGARTHLRGAEDTPDRENPVVSDQSISGQRDPPHHAPGRVPASVSCEEVRDKWHSDAMELIGEVPPIVVDENVVACDGGPNPAMGHPIEYIRCDENEPSPSVCKYCGLRFIHRNASETAAART